MTEEIADFESFYKLKIEPYLAELIQEETALRNWKNFTISTGIAAFAIFFLHYLKWLPSGHIIAGAFFVMFIVGVIFCARYSDQYLEDFKEKIIGQIISFISPAAVYKPMSYVSKKEYVASGLFRERFTHFDGDDYWECVYNGVSFHCSEIKSRQEDVGRSSAIFKGLFFAAKINPFISGGTYIWRRGNAQLPSSVADEHYRMFSLPHVNKVRIDHEAFNKHYTVYSTNAAESVYILSDAMMDHMVTIKEKLNRDIVFSFVSGRCFIAVPFEENLLEPSAKGVADKESIKNYFFTILLVFNLIHTLELKRLT